MIGISSNRNDRRKLLGIMPFETHPHPPSTLSTIRFCQQIPSCNAKFMHAYTTKTMIPSSTIRHVPRPRVNRESRTRSSRSRSGLDLGHLGRDQSSRSRSGLDLGHLGRDRESRFSLGLSFRYCCIRLIK